MLRPLGEKVVIARDETPDKTEGGIYIPDQAKEPITRGTVMSVGSGVVAFSKLSSRLDDAWKRFVQLHPVDVGELDDVIQDVLRFLCYRGPTVWPGDKVLFGEYTGNPARIKDEEGVEHDCVLCDESEIYGVIEE